MFAYGLVTLSFITLAIIVCFFGSPNLKLCTKLVMRYLPVVLKSGKGIRVTDIDGKTYLDCVASAGTIPLVIIIL